MKKSVLAAALALSACAPKPQAPSMQYVYCVTAEQLAAIIKAEPAKVGGTLTGDARKDVKIEAESNVLLRQYADGLLEIIGKCTP